MTVVCAIFVFWDVELWTLHLQLLRRSKLWHGIFLFPALISVCLWWKLTRYTVYSKTLGLCQIGWHFLFSVLENAEWKQVAVSEACKELANHSVECWMVPPWSESSMILPATFSDQKVSWKDKQAENCESLFFQNIGFTFLMLMKAHSALSDDFHIQKMCNNQPTGHFTKNFSWCLTFRSSCYDLTWATTEGVLRRISFTNGFIRRAMLILNGGVALQNLEVQLVRLRLLAIVDESVGLPWRSSNCENHRKTMKNGQTTLEVIQG